LLGTKDNELNLAYNYNILAMIENACHANSGSVFVKMPVKKLFNIYRYAKKD
jgi:hypothetical protein